jgi:hypothetical protein
MAGKEDLFVLAESTATGKVLPLAAGQIGPFIPLNINAVRPISCSAHLSGFSAVRRPRLAQSIRSPINALMARTGRTRKTGAGGAGTAYTIQRETVNDDLVSAGRVGPRSGRLSPAAGTSGTGFIAPNFGPALSGRYAGYRPGPDTLATASRPDT